MASSVSNKYSYSDTFEGTSILSDTFSPEIVPVIPFDEDKNIRTSQYSSASLSKGSTQTLPTKDKTITTTPSQYSSPGYQTQTTKEHSSGSLSCDRTSHTRTYTSDVSDTLTYQDDFTDAEGGTDVEDAFSYSDTFEDSMFPTMRSSVPEERDSRLDTVTSEDTSCQERKYLEDSFESPSLTVTSRDGHTLDFTESHIFGPATEEIRELSAEDLAKAEAFEASENFISKLLGRLRVSKMVSANSTRPQQVKKVSKSHDEKKFCQRTINQLRSHKTGETGILASGADRSKTSCSQPVESYGLASAVVDRLKLEHLMHKMKKLSTQEIHDIHKCRPCRNQQKRLQEAESRQDFLNYHHHRLQARNMDARVDSHLTRMTSINLIGELVQTLPHPGTSSGDLLYLYKQQLHRRMDA
ncbi:uncharacterized protein LOC124281581 [Haliotis rubra]|uniref:uncharacterized protein LOC124281581 n=1 Tax=Haliotis rubra TaxID=36100 RepID=UPI001EE52278|nr:uncharacterized protein LOC124281581 [Haliotis rubra]XP_046573483.1 uncharacterized protein LOC124281581 [Haliotis rubra]XP_046573484.1 uncharacterized protein LOC124281581 [Haliotis rubra]